MNMLVHISDSVTEYYKGIDFTVNWLVVYCTCVYSHWVYLALHNVSVLDVQLFWFSKLLSNGLLSSVGFIRGTNHHRSQEIGFENSTHRTFILFRWWPVQSGALSCMLMLSPGSAPILLMCRILYRCLLLYITPTAPLLLISSFLTSIFPAPPPPVHPSERCHGRGASMLLPDAAIKALHLTQADTS